MNGPDIGIVRAVVAILALAGMVTPAVCGGIDLAARDGAGRASFSIVVGAEASPCERYAAEELRDYLLKISGTDVPIATDADGRGESMVLVGRTRFTDEIAPGTDYAALGPDGFRLRAAGGCLAIAADPLGVPGAGVLYGVYELLERFGGCGWFASWHEVVPKSPRFVVPADIDDVQTPAFDLRQATWRDVHSDRANAYRNRLNPPFLGDPKFGGSRSVFCPALNTAHTFARIVPAEEHFEKHPEYFAEVGGVRKTGQLCLSNPDVLKMAVARVRAELAKHYPSGIHYYGVSQNDGNRDYCRCVECRALDEAEGSPVASILRFANAIAENVEKDYPQAVIETLAYDYSARPPKTMKPRHNVMPCVCTIRCDFSKPFTTSRYPKNVETAVELEKWGKIASRLYVWDYTTDFGAYMYPFANVHTIRENVRFFRDCGVTKLYEQGNYQGLHGDWAELKAWLLGKYMWNPDAEEAPLLRRFFGEFYGPAAEVMREAFDALHSLPRDETVQPLKVGERIEACVVPDGFLDEQAALYARAAKLAEGTRYARNVAYQAMSADFPRVIRYLASPDYGSYFCSRHPERIDAARREAMIAAARRVLAVVDEPGMPTTRLAESQGVKYLRQLREFVVSSMPTQAVDRLTIEDSLLGDSGYPGYVSRVKDATAGDGSAYRCSSLCYEWAGGFDISSIMTDADGVYKLRVRLCVDVKPDAPSNGEVFWAGVYNHASKKASMPVFSLKACEVPDAAYHWYDVGEWTPKSRDSMWSGGGRFKDGRASHNGCWIDCFELVRVR